MPIELRPHQETGVDKMHNGCILYGDVGVGKTITSLAYYFERVCGGTLNKWGSMSEPKDVYVITTAKVRDGKDFEVQAAQMGVHTNSKLSTNGVKITVDSWNNLHKYVEVENAFFIFDEQRVVGYGAWSRAFIKVARHNEWVLLSATPGDTWLDYIPVFIANGWYKHKTDFIDQHVIWTPRVKYPKVLRYQHTGVLVRRRNQVLVHMPYERHTTRHAVDIRVDYDADLFDKAVKKRWHVYENRPLRDVSELFGVMRRVVNSHSSRLEAVERLLATHPKLIVFYNFDYELEMLRTLVPANQMVNQKRLDNSTSSIVDVSTKKSEKCQTKSSKQKPDDWEWLLSPEGMKANKVANGSAPGSKIPSSTSTGTPHTTGSSRSSLDTFAVAEWNGHKHEPIPATERWLYLVQYRAGAEGWNCVETDAIAFYSQTYSYRDWFQAHGRIDRLNTPFSDLYYYYLISTSIIDKAIRKALKAKKSFNEKDLDLKVT